MEKTAYFWEYEVGIEVIIANFACLWKCWLFVNKKVMISFYKKGRLWTRETKIHAETCRDKNACIPPNLGLCRTLYWILCSWSRSACLTVAMSLSLGAWRVTFCSSGGNLVISATFFSLSFIRTRPSCEKNDTTDERNAQCNGQSCTLLTYCDVQRSIKTKSQASLNTSCIADNIELWSLAMHYGGK